VIDTRQLAEQGAWTPEWSVLSSVLSAVVLTGLAAYEFLTTAY